MDVYVLKTVKGLDEPQLTEAFKDVGDVHFIRTYTDEFSVKDAIPLTHFNVEKDKSIDPVALKIQNLNAWEAIFKRDLPHAIVVLDTVRLVNSFVKGVPGSVPKGADLCIFSATNLRINGVHLNGTDWVYLDSDDREFNNICNAYFITKEAAKRLYAHKNELLNSPDPFALWINAMSNRMATERIKTFMSFQSTSSKPIYVKSA